MHVLSIRISRQCDNYILLLNWSGCVLHSKLILLQLVQCFQLSLITFNLKLVTQGPLHALNNILWAPPIATPPIRPQQFSFPVSHPPPTLLFCSSSNTQYKAGKDHFKHNYFLVWVATKMANQLQKTRSLLCFYSCVYFLHCPPAFSNENFRKLSCCYLIMR